MYAQFKLNLLCFLIFYFYPVLGFGQKKEKKIMGTLVLFGTSKYTLGKHLKRLQSEVEKNFLYSISLRKIYNVLMQELLIQLS